MSSGSGCSRAGCGTPTGWRSSFARAVPRCWWPAARTPRCGPMETLRARVRRGAGRRGRALDRRARRRAGAAARPGRGPRRDVARARRHGPRNAGPAGVVEDLDALAPPLRAQQLFDPSWYDPAATAVIPGGLLTSRGCPAHCTFCANYVTGRRFRHRSAGDVVAEIRAWHDLCGVTFFPCWDDALTADRKRLVDALRRVRARAGLPVQLERHHPREPRHARVAGRDAPRRPRARQLRRRERRRRDAQGDQEGDQDRSRRPGARARQGGRAQHGVQLHARVPAGDAGGARADSGVHGTHRAAGRLVQHAGRRWCRSPARRCTTTSISSTGSPTGGCGRSTPATAPFPPIADAPAFHRHYIGRRQPRAGLLPLLATRCGS